MFKRHYFVTLEIRHENNTLTQSWRVMTETSFFSDPVKTLELAIEDVAKTVKIENRKIHVVSFNRI